MATQLAYALRQSDLRIISIKETQRGKSCACICPSCKKPLIARQGEKNDWHFAHANGEECLWAQETALHLLCKQIITEQRYIRLANGRKFWYAAAEKEKSFSNLRADSWIQSSTQEWIIEIFVTNEVTPRKHALIRNLNISAFEIDVSQVPRDIGENALRMLIIEGLDGKSLLYEKREKVEPATGVFKLPSFLKKILSIALVIGIVYFVYRIFSSPKKKRYLFR